MYYNGQEIKCTVKELRELLNGFNDDDKVLIYGGEGYDGEFVELWVSETPVCSDDKDSLY